MTYCVIQPPQLFPDEMLSISAPFHSCVRHHCYYYGYLSTAQLEEYPKKGKTAFSEYHEESLGCAGVNWHIRYPALCIHARSPL